MCSIIIEVDSLIKIQSVEELYADDLYKLISENSEHLKPYLPAVLSINSFDAAVEHIRHCQHLASKNELLEFHIFYEKQLCGAIRLNNFENENSKASIAYLIGKTFQGKGIITRSANEIIKYAFSQLKLNRIELRCVTTNQPSISVAQRLGFKYEGELREADFLNNHFVNHYIYSLLFKDFNHPKRK